MNIALFVVVVAALVLGTVISIFSVVRGDKRGGHATAQVLPFVGCGDWSSETQHPPGPRP
jgi:hypothetical protein